MEIPFWKMEGTGNDFIVIDNRVGYIKKRKFFTIKYCNRKFGIGADGVLFLENSTKADFKMRIFNADGTEAEMCGNGARCIAKFAYINGIAEKKMKFETLSGIISGEINKNSIKVGLSNPFGLIINQKISIFRKSIRYSFINTGVPHVIILDKDYGENIDKIPVNEVGRGIRFHKSFAPAGTNVNFISILSKNRIKIRTYERGVEAETLACGTGSTASAIISAVLGFTSSPISVLTKSGENLKVFFCLEKFENKIRIKENSVFLEGRVNQVFTGIIK